MGTADHQDSVVLGMGAAWGFSGSDLTSPALAGQAGALPDALAPMAGAEPPVAFTELRVHGVSGSDGATMLEHPTVLQVAGDATTGFYRRWSPSARARLTVPWNLEAYSWGGLTEAPLASASWLLVAPLMFFNLAHFALPSACRRSAAPPAAAPADGTALGRDARHSLAQVVLRLLAFSATVQLMLGLVTVLVNTLAVQAPLGRYPAWAASWTTWSTHRRVLLAAAALALVLALLWMLSVRTANQYEARVTRSSVITNDQWALTEPGFWRGGGTLVRRQRSLHAAGGLAVAALILSRPFAAPDAPRLIVAWSCAVVLLLCVITLCLPFTDRHTVTVQQGQATARQAAQQQSTNRVGAATRWCQAILWIAGLVYLASTATTGWPAVATRSPRTPSPGVTVAGLDDVWLALTAAQVVLLLVLAVSVWMITLGSGGPSGQGSEPGAHDAGEQDRPTAAPPAPRVPIVPGPFLRGHLATVFAVLGIGLGGAYVATLSLFVTNLLGTPVPSSAPWPGPTDALQVPWALYAFAVAPVGAVLGLLVAGVWVYLRWRSDRSRFAQAGPDARPSPVAAFYGRANGDADSKDYSTAKRTIAGVWATGLIADRGGVVGGCAAAGMVVVTAAGQLLLSPDQLLHLLPVGVVDWIASAVSVIGVLVAGALISLLRTAYSDPSRRKTIGVIWDVGTFWPRAAHPFAPPCYAERAVPELVDRIRILTGTVTPCPDDPAWRLIQAHERDACVGSSVPTGPVLLTGYSQGAVIAPAVLAQLPPQTLERVGLLTLACPARRLYGRAFPRYFGPQQLAVLQESLGSPSGSAGPVAGRWRNLVRHSDFIGSWVLADPGVEAPGQPDRRKADVDLVCRDPVVVTANLDPTPPLIHRHSDWWGDPQVPPPALLLGEQLRTEHAARPRP